MIKNGVDGVGESETDEQHANSAGGKKSSKDKDGDEEMTVVLPPSKASKNSGIPGKEHEGEIAMNGTDESESKTADDAVDPQATAIDSRSSP